MCAARERVHAAALSDLAALFSGRQQGYFTHIWGFKQQMRDEPPALRGFLPPLRCAAAARLSWKRQGGWPPHRRSPHTF